MPSTGRALAVALASRGVQITVLDLEATKGKETVRLVEEAHAKISYKPSSLRQYSYNVMLPKLVGMALNYTTFSGFSEYEVLTWCV